MSKENFKLFVHKNPELVNYVNKGEMTWQKFYEIYDLYGENNSIWDKYIKRENKVTSLLGDTSLKDIFNTIKQIDLDSVKKGVDGLQKVVGLASDIVANNNIGKVNTSSYTRRPLYKYFED